MKVLLAHPGTQHSFQLANQLQKAGLLYRFYTGLAISERSLLTKVLKFLPAFVFKKFSNRIVDGLPSAKIHNFPFLEIQTLSSKKGAIYQERNLYKRNERFQKLIPDKVIRNSDLVIGFDTSSWILAERCKALGTKFILDVSIGHPLSKEKIYQKLSAQFPLWKEQVIPKKQIFIDWEAREMNLADLIIVPGQFVKQTLEENNVPATKIATNQFGTNTSLFNINLSEKKAGNKIRFLFLGAFTARKGLPFLLEAWRDLNCSGAELIIAGYGALPPGIILPDNVINRGSVAKDDRQELFYNADVFLFPSFFEGLAIVQIEAMSGGLPVVGTKNSGASELVDDGINGFVIAAGDKVQLQQSIRYFIENPARILEMGTLAQKKAASFTWNNYGRRWINILSSL